MTLDDWQENGWLKQHATSKQEITELLAIADRDIAESKSETLHNDWRFNIAYNAALQLAAAALAANGYRVDRGGGNQHYRTIDALSLTLGSDEKTVRIFDIFRRKRNTSDYEHVGAATEKDVKEVHALAVKLRADLLSWLDKNHPNLVPD